MANLLSIWAKIGKNTYPDRFHPLACHSLDVGHVAGAIWDDLVVADLKRRQAFRFGLNADLLGRWFSFWAALHDIGKACPGFQGSSLEARNVQERLGFRFQEQEKPPHATVSARWLAESLCTSETFDVERVIARRVATCVGGHHGIFPTAGNDVSTCRRALRGSDWETARCAIAKLVAMHLGVLGTAKPTWDGGMDQSPFLFLAGLTTVADWITSNVDLFPPAGNPSTLSVDTDDFLCTYTDQSRRQAHEALRRLGWGGWQRRSSEFRPFVEVFSELETPRPLQLSAEKLALSLSEPALVVVEAPMGEGKTESAFYLADHWIRRQSAQGAFVALPTQATANAMFGRFQRFLDDTIGGRKDLHLIHGRALLNDVYRGLQHFAKIYDSDSKPDAVVAERWFAADKRQAMLAPFGVGTVDQTLLGVLQVKHGFVRLFGLAGKVVILDEVHAYDTFMNTILERLLAWLHTLGCSVVVLSATLPAERRAELISAFLGSDAAVPPASYPRITVARPSGVTVECVDADPLRRQTVWMSRIDETTLIDRVATALSRGGCAAVIRNTVAAAQTTFRVLRSVFPQGCVRLFHARFPFEDRQRIETEIQELYGRIRGAIGPSVLIATQVVEQSLDLDFDLLITDWAPVDLLLQRAGRLWRHRREDRPADLHRPELWLIDTPETCSEPPQFGVSEYIYHRYLLLRTYLSLASRATLTLPDDIDLLVQEVYGRSPPSCESALAESMESAWRELVSRRREQEHKARNFLVAGPLGTDDVLPRFSRDLDEEDPALADARRAVTRDALPSITLIFLYRIQGSLYLDPAGQVPVDLSTLPSLAQMEQLLGRSVSISSRGCFGHYSRSPAIEAWRRSGLLRYCRVVELDASGRSLPEEYPLRLDAELGIIFDREDPNEGMDR